MDAECHERHQAFPRAFLPLYLQTSRPDVILFVGSNLPQQQQHSYIPAGTRMNAVVHLVEVGYTSDMRVHEHVQIKHRQLRQNLLSYGWGSVNVLAFIMGHTGVMSQANADILQELGVSFPSIDSVLADLAVSSLQKSCAISSCFPKVSKRPDAACDDGRSTPGRNDDGSASLQAALTPHSAGGISESHATLPGERGGMPQDGLGIAAHPPLGGGQSNQAPRSGMDIHLAPPPHQISLVPANQPLPSGRVSCSIRKRAVSIGPGALSSSLRSDPTSSSSSKRRKLAQAGPVIGLQDSGMQHSHTEASIQTVQHQPSLPGAPQNPSSLPTTSADAHVVFPQPSVRRTCDPGGG